MLLKKELKMLAEEGARQRLIALERELGLLYREFPNIFIRGERPMLVNAEQRSGNGNGNGYVRLSPGEYAEATTAHRAVIGAAIRASWTPARRAKQSKLMKERKRQERLHAGKASKTSKASKALASKGWAQRWYEHLKQAGGPVRLRDSQVALRAEASTLLSSSADYLKHGNIKKIKKGYYAAGEAPSE